MSNGAEAAGGRPVRVLICDDAEAMRVLLQAVIGLRPSLQFVGEAGDGDAVVSEATRLQPDVIMLDLAMPRRTGLEAIAELRRVAPVAKIIVFSGFATASVAEDVLELGAARYLPKGADVDEINDTIEEVAAQVTPDAVATGSTAAE